MLSRFVFSCRPTRSATGHFWKAVLLARIIMGFCALALPSNAADKTSNGTAPAPTPVKVIFDTDIGNDVDDVLALAMLHSLQARRQCDLLAVTLTKPDELAGPFVSALDTFYGYPNIPIGFTQSHITNEPSKFLSLANEMDGEKLRYPHNLKRSSDARPATEVLRCILAAEADRSVALIQVGFFSNLAALLDTGPDKASPLSGSELVKQKVRMLSVMAGAFEPIRGNTRYGEYNVIKDLPSARKVAKEWPTPIVWSGFEIGVALPYPAVSIEHDFNYVQRHPVAEAYRLYNPPPHERPTWDLTSVLFAVFPDRNYFDLSNPGRVTVTDEGATVFSPARDGRDRFLILKPDQRPRVKEALVQLASEPPHHIANTH